MAATVNLPGVGPVDERWVIAGVALIAGIAGWAWYQRGRAPIEEAPPEVDEFADAAVDAYEGAFGTPALTPHPLSEPGYLPPGSDAEWAQRAQIILTGVNYDPLTAATAIGKYLTRQTLTPTEADIVRVAIAQLGPPPVGSYPVTVAAVPTPPVASTDTSSLWDVWQGERLARGQVHIPGATGAEDWGMIARRTLGPTATRSDVYFRSLELQQRYPELHKKYPLYVPNNIIPQIR